MIIVGRVVVGRCALVGALKCSLAGDTMKHNRVGRAELCPLPGRGADCRGSAGSVGTGTGTGERLTMALDCVRRANPIGRTRALAAASGRGGNVKQQRGFRCLSVGQIGSGRADSCRAMMQASSSKAAGEKQASARGGAALVCPRARPPACLSVPYLALPVIAQHWQLQRQQQRRR